ncbi:polysaccharide deacetylase family protein [Haladaptatus sp. R4]|uniref:polysaccharide deacetylase family protein n=1 Tax=Haladaptatus sp. R4 TaxID=1679489 RepID=UPI0009EE5FA1|nr:polysaccharide deacetylase family protein [Haladaptatus sp. R4]
MELSRRGFLKLSTSTALAGAVTATTVGAQSTTENAQAVIVYDDGPVTDYQKAFPVHKDEGVPASIGIVSEWVGTDGSGSMDRALNKKELTEMESFGFEIMSHTREHTSLKSFPLAKDIAPDDDRAYPNGTHASHPFHAGYEVEIYDGDSSVTRNIVGSGRNDDDELYMKLDKPVGMSFDADSARERLSPKTMRYILRDSKRTLESYGFTVDNLLAPYDHFTEYSEKFTKEFYTGVANAIDSNGINQRGEIDPYGTRRDYFIEFTDWSAVRDELDAVAEDNALGIFGAHTQRDEVTKSKIRRMIRAAKSRDIEIVTLRQALADAGFGATRTTTTTNTTTTSTTPKTTTTMTTHPPSTDSAESSDGSMLETFESFGIVGGVGAVAGFILGRRSESE